MGLIRIWPKFRHFCLLFFKFSAGLIRMRVLFEGGSLSRIYGIYLGNKFSFILKATAVYTSLTKML